MRPSAAHVAHTTRTGMWCRAADAGYMGVGVGGSGMEPGAGRHLLGTKKPNDPRETSNPMYPEDPFTADERLGGGCVSMAAAAAASSTLGLSRRATSNPRRAASK